MPNTEVMNQPIFAAEQIYKRSQIHDNFGGNRQGGISPSAKGSYIFIFSGQSGHQHGYKDQWENDDIFSYTGEGQLNDMQFIKGNLALREHLRRGKRVFLFFHHQKAFVKFEAELELDDVDYFAALDREGNERKAIKFFFKRVGRQLQYDKQSQFAADPAVNANIPNETERKGLVTSRVGQGAYRKSILYRWNFKCAVTDYSKNQILIASHIVSWKKSSNVERLDVNNGILLSPTYDALFDQHLISFENTGKIILSDSLKTTNYQAIGVSGKEIIKGFRSDNHFYLERHRSNLK